MYTKQSISTEVSTTFNLHTEYICGIGLSNRGRICLLHNQSGGGQLGFSVVFDVCRLTPCFNLFIFTF
jgi:hypothetical protein